MLFAEEVQRALMSQGYDVLPIVSRPEDFLNMYRAQRPDLILVDINLHGQMVGVDLIKSVSGPSLPPFIYLTAYDDPEIVETALSTGPCAYLLKPVRLKQILLLVDLALSGTRHIVRNSSLASEPSSSLHWRIPGNIAQLSPSEEDILAHVLKGCSSEEVARRTGRAEKTVRNHLTSIYRKLRVKSRSELFSIFLQA